MHVSSLSTSSGDAQLMRFDDEPLVNFGRRHLCANLSVIPGGHRTAIRLAWLFLCSSVSVLGYLDEARGGSQWFDLRQL